MSLALDNQTRWRTDDLRKLITAALDADGLGAAGVSVTVRTAKQGSSTTGCAWHGSRRMVVRIPSPNVRDFAGPWATRLVLPAGLRDDLAKTVIHEAAHCRGVHHAEMHGNLRRTHSARHCTDDRDVGFAAAFQVRLQRPRPVAKRDLLGERADHAARMLARAERRLKLARTLATKWRAKVRYYERRAAAQGAK